MTAHGRWRRSAFLFQREPFFKRSPLLKRACLLGTCLAPCSKPALGNERVPLEVRVSPEAKVDPGSSSNLFAPATAYKRAYEKTKANLNDLEGNSVNSDEIPGQSGSAPSDAGVSGLVKDLPGAAPSRYASPGQFPSLRFRGTPAFEPVYYIEGIPLTGIFSGAQAADLLPAHFISRVAAFPDFPPFSYAYPGIGGGVEFSVCSSAFPCRLVLPGSGTATRVSLAAGSFGYVDAGASLERPTASAPQFFSGALGAGHGREDFLARDDNNTLFDSGDDSFKARTNNDFRRAAAGALAEFTAIPLLGKVSLLTIGGADERGVPGPVGSRTAPRLARSLLISLARSKRVLPESGLALTTSLSHRQERGRLNAQNGSFRGAAAASNDTRAAESAISFVAVLPDAAFDGGATSVALRVSQSTLRSKADSESGASGTRAVSAQMAGLRAAAARRLALAAGSDFAPTLELSTALDLASSGFRADCARNAELLPCDVQRKQVEPALATASASLQAAFPAFVPYARFAFNQRRPYVSERYGSANGVLENEGLRAERGLAIETGIRVPYGRVFLFYARDRNLILLERLNPALSQYRNLEKVDRYGMEALAAIRLFSRFELAAESSVTLSKQGASPVKWIPRLSRYREKLALRMDDLLDGAAALLDFPAYVEAEHQSGFFLDSENSSYLEMRPTLNAGLSVQQRQVSHGVRLSGSLRVMNLGNATEAVQTDASGRRFEVDHAGYYGFPVSGRRVIAGVSLDF